MYYYRNCESRKCIDHVQYYYHVLAGDPKKKGTEKQDGTVLTSNKAAETILMQRRQIQFRFTLHSKAEKMNKYTDTVRYQHQVTIEL